MSEQQGTLFEHCARALDRSLAVGSHGLPLIGTGDWNDGMNRVGSAGKAKACGSAGFSTPTSGSLRGSPTYAASTSEPSVATAVSGAQASPRTRSMGWRVVSRAYFDDGTPLGSAMNAECRIDSIAQSWGHFWRC